mmetsp:Transcript_5240/g.9631  ORF Transcript_5240/g.9631 Transcript_5240/m.9631 type:complete len:309 (-) Transcript_5240:94-1020(-)|eukprot:CAMPEP_0183717028 /NCGR_PEP_ID=MMETSP0737-20130205/10744_1 /TAXON_ID=385413 /ORGANISM="Thalassiosira miniscula, Strain CCMP1093" /LENGTH=308 /DNA_ID=CAMNT_0025946383 /DNA_START=164 /DNA_END=1090 /DNA_ORIENTATION=+
MMDQLPEDILRKVVGYLASSGALGLACTSKSIRSQLSLATTNPRRILNKFYHHDCNDDIHRGFQIPVPSQQMVSVHSTRLSINWRDQGWGNRKSQVFVIATKKDQTPYESAGSVQIWNDERKEFGGGRVVYRSEIAPHSMGRLTITFMTKQEESYHLWYVVGGGGGHAISLEDVKVQSLLFGDSSQTFAKAHNFLVESKIFGAWDQSRSTSNSPNPHLLTTICETVSYLLKQSQNVPPPIISFFGDYGMSEMDLSVSLMDSIKSLLSTDGEDATALNLQQSDNDGYMDYDRQYLDYDDHIHSFSESDY